MRPRSGPALGRPLVFFSLLGLYLLVFTVTPLWTRFGEPLKQGLVLGALTLLGLAWAWVSSGPVRLPRTRTWALFLGYSLAALALNFRALTASIPWRGDEDHHVVFTLDLARMLIDRPWYLLLAALPPLLALTAGRGPDRGRFLRLLPGALAFAVLAPILLLTADVDADPYDIRYHVLRYPILLKYLAAIPVWFYSLLPPTFPPELPYRILPLAAAAGLATFTTVSLRRLPLGIRLAAGLVVLTLPLVRYYTSIFYLEMPAVLCMAIAAFRADRLLRAEPSRLPTMPAWYALLLVGFIKETTLPFLAAYCACRILARGLILFRAGRLRPQALPAEAAVLFAVCLPLFLYLVFRSHFGDPRPMGLQLSNLKQAHLALRLAHSLLDSFTFLLPVAFAGSVLPFFRVRRHPTAMILPPAFLLLAAVLSAALHYLDDPAFIGYSRFNLFLLPSLLALALPALALLARKSPSLAGATLVLFLTSNALLSPLLADGSKQPLWGVYGLDTGEHYYPYRAALRDLVLEHGGENALLTGHYHGYFVRFYTGNREWPVQRLMSPDIAPPELTPAAETARMDSVLAAAEGSGYTAVIYQILGPEYRLPENLHGYGNVKVYRNRAHALVRFAR